MWIHGYTTELYATASTNNLSIDIQGAEFPQHLSVEQRSCLLTSELPPSCHVSPNISAARLVLIFIFSGLQHGQHNDHIRALRPLLTPLYLGYSNYRAGVHSAFMRVSNQTLLSQVQSYHSGECTEFSADISIRIKCVF